MRENEKMKENIQSEIGSEQWLCNRNIRSLGLEVSVRHGISVSLSCQIQCEKRKWGNIEEPNHQPQFTAMWMGRRPSCDGEEVNGMRDKRYNATVKTDITHSKQYQLRSTYVVLNRKGGRITFQQHTNHFHVTFHCSKVDGKGTILIRGRNEKRVIYSDEK